MPLPWQEVNSRESQTVAERIGLAKAAEARKWACPFCGSSDALHAYSGPGAGFGCWAACGAAQPKGCRGYSNIDVAVQHWGTGLAESCRRLAALLGIVYEDDPLPARRRPAAGGVRARSASNGPSAQECNLAAVRAIPGGRLPPTVYGDVVAQLRLSDRGAAYLARQRRLDERTAEGYGYRSLDGRRAWAALADHLRGCYGPEELAAAGFPVGDQGAVTLPFNGCFPALLIPFRRGAEVVGLRFRNLLPDHPDYKHNRYRTLAAARPLWPYEADALRRPVLHVVEGELNAETLRQLGHPAAGLYGAGAWLDAWTSEVAGAHRIVAWYDCRDAKRAGDLGAAALRSRLAAAYGEAWITQRWRRMLTDCDPNALHHQGRLACILQAKPWERTEGPEVHAA